MIYQIGFSRRTDKKEKKFSRLNLCFSSCTLALFEALSIDMVVQTIGKLPKTTAAI